MAPPPEDSNGGEPAAGDAARSLPTPFLTKTYQLVDDRSLDDVISWNEDGSTFVVWNPTEFSRDLLPKYFKHNNFSSFVRQLNTYGFRKIMPDRWEFSNEFFRRGEKRLLCDINRRKATAPAVAAVAVPAVAPPGPPVGTVSSSNSGEEQVISSNSSPPTSFGSTTEIMNENERLRRENRELNKELSQMKNLCSNIYALTSNYAGNRPESSSQAAKPLDLMPAARQFDDDNRSEPKDQTGARLFGFSIGAKRSREGEDLEWEEPLSSEEEEAAVQRDSLQLQLGGAKVKSEPSDCPNGSDDLWLRQFHRANQRNGE